MPAAKPRIADELEEAPSELEDDAEWVATVATGDYIGQTAEHVSFTDVVARGGRWSGVTLEHFDGTRLRFENCDLSGFVLRDNASVRLAEFVGCRLSGSVLAGTKLRDVSFVSCSFEEANLRMIDAESVDFEDCALLATDLYAAKIAKARFKECNLRGVDLTKATLSEVDLRNSRVEDILGADALRGCTIGEDQVIPLARSLAAALDLRVLADDE